MNPWYLRPGYEDLRTAFREAIRMAYRWGDRWYVYQDIVDHDFHAFAIQFTKTQHPRYRCIGHTDANAHPLSRFPCRIHLTAPALPRHHNHT